MQALFAMKQCSVILLLVLLSTVSVEGSSVRCETCKQDLSDLKTALLPQLTQESIAESLTIICESYSENERTACTQNIAAHAVPVLRLLKNVNEEGVCAAIGHCEDLRTPPFLDVMMVSGNDTTDFDLEYRGMICAACTTTMKFLHSLLSDRAVQRTIVQVLTRVCYFTGRLRIQCLSFLNRYAPMIIDLVETQLTPKLCKTLYLCPRVAPVPEPMVSSGIFCSVCKRVTDTVRFLIHDKDNEKRVIALAKLMCNKLPSPLNVMCDGLVSFALPQLFDYLRSNCQMIGRLCKILGFCSRQQMAIGTQDQTQEKGIDGRKYPKLFFVPKQRRSTRL